MEQNSDRVVWIDWMRVIACFMVMVVHSTEPFYLGGDGSLIATEADMWWAAICDSMVRCCVPLFIVVSSFLQFPLHYDAVTFAKKRAVRILVPFAIWSVFYALYWGEPVQNLKDLLLNFNYAAGHLWFVYMLIGLYIIMPLLSPWAERVSRKELSIYIGLWLFTTLIPLVRAWVGGAPSSVIYGPGGLPRTVQYPLWGEVSWNSYGTFYYVSGLAGYMLLGLWFRRYGCDIHRARALRLGVLGYFTGLVIVAGGFLKRVMETSGGVFPASGSVLDATWWETTWCFDTIGVAVMTIGMILLFQNIKADGWFYSHVVMPVSKASYGMYLGHMVALASYSALFRSLPSTPVAIVATAVCSYVTVAVCAVILQRIPKIGKYIIG